MAQSPLNRLTAAVGYPEEAPEGAVEFTFQVDGAAVRAEASGARIILSLVLANAPGELELQQIASWAAGRILREDATIAADPRTGEVILWQDEASNTDSRTLHRFFETFLNSVDWWRERIDSLRSVNRENVDESLVIRP